MKPYVTFCLSCFLVIFGFPGESVGISAITDSVLESTGLSRNIFSVVYTCATVTGCFLILVTGPAIDKLGIRKASLAALLLWTVIFLTFANGEFFYERIWRGPDRQLFFILFLYLCLSVLRFLGQNMLPMLGRVQIVKVFAEKQGIAVAVSSVFVAITSGLAPRIMRFLAGGGNWQGAYETLAMVSFGAFIIFFLFFEDGGASNTGFAEKQVELKKSFGVITRRKLLGQPIFWCITLTLCINAFIGSGTMVHIVDIFRENGSSAIALNSQLYLCCVSVLAGPLFGKWVDQGRIKSCVLTMLCVQFLGLIGLEFAKYAPGFFLYVVCIGASWGGYGVLRTAAWSKIFGAKNIGSILGLIYFCSAIVGAVSVSLMSFSRKSFGSYFHLIHLTECVIVGVVLLVIGKFPTRA